MLVPGHTPRPRTSGGYRCHGAIMIGAVIAAEQEGLGTVTLQKEGKDIG